MRHHHTARRAAVALAGALALAVPASAGAAVTQQVHDDGGNFVPITPGLAISNMSPRVTISAAPADADKYYTYAVVGPNGAAVAIDSSCSKLQYGALSRLVNFVGVGQYTMTTYLYSDSACKTPTSGGVSGTFTINAGATIATPTTPVLTRDPGSYVTKSYLLPAAVSPNGTQQILYRNLGVFDPVTGISGATIDDTAYKVNGQAQVSFRTPGRYTFVTRAYAGSPQAFTPWSAPQYVDAKAPFDLDSIRWIDSRGPSYRVRLKFRESAVNGQVRIRVRRTSGGRYRTVGRPKARGGTVSKRFTLGRSGRYQLRVEFGGSSLIAPGHFTLGFRITRRYI